MGLFFNFFKNLAVCSTKQKLANNRSSKITVTVINPKFGSEARGLSQNQLRAEELASQAVQMKEIQLKEAITLLREAVNLWPENKEILFRLARYLREAGFRDDSFAIYRKLTLELDRRDYLMFGFNQEAILDEMIKQLFEEKNYTYYLFYHLQKLWSTLLALAAQGRYIGMDDNIFMTYGAQTKIKKALKSLDIFEQYENIAREVFEHLNRAAIDLSRLSEISKANEFPSERLVGLQGSIGERHLAALHKNEEFISLFNRLASPLVPEQIYNEVILSRLKQNSTDGS